MTMISHHVWDHVWGDVPNSFTLKNEKHINHSVRTVYTLHKMVQLGYDVRC
jgi:hypothetical protein